MSFVEDLQDISENARESRRLAQDARHIAQAAEDRQFIEDAKRLLIRPRIIKRCKAAAASARNGRNEAQVFSIETEGGYWREGSDDLDWPDGCYSFFKKTPPRFERRYNGELLGLALEQVCAEDQFQGLTPKHGRQKHLESIYDHNRDRWSNQKKFYHYVYHGYVSW